LETTTCGSGLSRIADGWELRARGLEHTLDRIESKPKSRSMKIVWPPKLTSHHQEETLRSRDAGEPMHGIAKSYNVGDNTISRWAE
jgi:hypothetical protein